jgi:hypothetical protein
MLHQVVAMSHIPGLVSNMVIYLHFPVKFQDADGNTFINHGSYEMLGAKTRISVGFDIDIIPSGKLT